MRELFKTLPLMCVVLLVPVLPFLFFGGQFNNWLRGLAEDPPSSSATTVLVVGLLTTDILLPIPSSVVSTLSGWQLGWWRGTLASWTGLNIGSLFGFALARQWGQPFALFFSKAEDLERMRNVSDRYGPAVLVFTRAIPVFAEASVLISGIHQLAWRRFLPAVLLSNLGISIAYAAFGDFAERNQWLPFALAVAIAIPVLAATGARRFLAGSKKTNDESLMNKE